MTATRSASTATDRQDVIHLERRLVRRARALAVRAAAPVISLAHERTTVSVERAVLRLAGLRGADPTTGDGDIPWVNRVVDAVRDQVGLEHGVALPVWHAMRTHGYSGLLDLAEAVTAGTAGFELPTGAARTRAHNAATRAVRAGLRQIDGNRATRDRLINRIGDPPRRPWIYLIVATGDIFEDIPQAQAAARAGADVIAVIRSTGQSLLDFVPEGATRQGYAGTYATQENFRLMRAALDETSAEVGRYIRLTNYASGLCMPEIATLAGLERLDMMLNDSMYGILFRDINPQRTFVDQRFSRMIHARAGIIINTGEDNYLTTADAVEDAHTVTVSQLLNETFAHEAGLEDWQLGLGHAFEINPDLPESFRLELAHALLARHLFPEAPLKWMPPTKHMTGDIFRGYLLDGFFNLAGALTGQGILLVGMMTEAVVTPFLSDRDLALQNVRYVLDAAGGLTEDFHPPRGGFIENRANAVLADAVELLKRITHDGLLNAIADGTFGITKRPVDRGKGLEGVIVKAEGYDNPAVALMEADLGRGATVTETDGQGQVIRPYGDTTGDGMVQVSFTLPITHGPQAEGAALQLAARMGLDPAMVVHAKGLGGRDSAYTFFVVYGRVNHLVDLGDVVVQEREYPLLGAKEANLAIKATLRRKLVVLGACIGTDAHTVGIDAILNVKGFAGEKGLEYYREMKVSNLGAQVTVPELVSRARKDKADAVLVSQVVTQRDAHLRNTRELSAAFREAMGEQRPLIIVGGPRFDPLMAGELGVDRIFGRGTTPGEVASYLVHKLANKETARVR